MLIIVRRAGDSIFLGPDVEIRILEVSPSRVTVGIVAPRSLTVLRGEMKEIAEQNMAAVEARSAEALARLISQLRSSNSETSDR